MTERVNINIFKAPSAIPSAGGAFCSFLHCRTVVFVDNTTRPQLEKLMADLKTMLDESPYTQKGSNIVRLTSFGDSSINILVSAYLQTNAYAVFLEEQNDLNLNIMDIMQADGVDFAFPSTSVYIEKSGS